MRAKLPYDAGSYSYAGMDYANPHAVTSVGGTTYTYDNNGNVTAIGSLDYTWDWRNRLSGAERSGGGVTSYGYDHTGQRVFKATGTATTSYPNRYYNVASSSLTATTTKHIFTPDGTLLATVVGASTTATTTYIHPDHLGGTNVATDENGEVVQTLDYYPYGAQRVATGSFDEQRRFIGEEYDGDTEFSYLNARYYQGSRGQFISQDPVFVNLGVDRRTRALLADPQLQNAYAYSRNNPLIYVDQGGEFVDIPWISNSPYFQDAATAAYQQSAAWRFALDHPYAASALVGLGATAAAGSGVQAYAAFHAATYSGVGSAFIAEKLFAGSAYSLLTLSGLNSIRSSIRGFGQADLQNPSTYYSLVLSLALNAASLSGGHLGAISDTTQFGAITGQAAANIANNLVSDFRSPNVQTRTDAVELFNTAVGASTNESKLWTTPNGTVITWTGQIVSPGLGAN